MELTDWPKQKYSEKLENIRTIFRVYIQWYTFFWTLNIVALAFLYKGIVKENVMTPMLTAIIWLFVFLNALGIVACYFAWHSMYQTNNDAKELAMSIDSSADSPFNKPLINYSCTGGGLSLVANVICWILLLFYSA